MRQKLFLLFFLTFLFGCSRNEMDEKLDYSFIESYHLLDDNCSSIIKKILQPLNLENEQFKISEIYKLKVNLDTSIYSNDYNREFFIGLKYEPDSFALHIFHLIPSRGIIHQCRTIENKSKLIIQNTSSFFNNMSELGVNNCIGLDTTTKFLKVESNMIGVWSMVDSEILYGKWKNDSIKAGFSKSIYNHDWHFDRNKNLVIINQNSDTLVRSTYSLNSDKLIIDELLDTFSILTNTSSSILLRENEADEIIYLRKVNE